MPTTIQAYDNTALLIANGTLTAAKTYKVEFLNNSATFTAAHTAKTSVDNAGAYEVYGYGWTQGGEILSGVTVSAVSTSGAKFTASSPSVTLSGGSLTAYKYLVYIDDGASDAPLFFVTLNSALTVTDGNALGVSISTSGIYQLTQAA